MVGKEKYLDAGELQAALHDGNKEAFEYVFRENYTPLVNYASRIVYDREIARDVVQDVFCRLWDKHAELEAILSLKAYLFKLVYTSCIDSIRHKKVEAKFIDKALQDFYFDKIIQTPEAELKLISSDIQRQIMASVDKLPEKCRRIFMMCKIDGKSYHGVATELGISGKTVESQMTIALARLREDLEWLLLLNIIIITNNIFS